MARALRLGAPADLGIGRVREVGHGDAERHRACGPQRPGRAVRAILQAFDRVEHALARLRLDRETVVAAEHAGDDRGVTRAAAATSRMRTDFDLDAMARDS